MATLNESVPFAMQIICLMIIINDDGVIGAASRPNWCIAVMDFIVLLFDISTCASVFVLVDGVYSSVTI